MSIYLMLQYRMFVTHFPTHAALVRNTFLFVCFYDSLESTNPPTSGNRITESEC